MSARRVRVLALALAFVPRLAAAVCAPAASGIFPASGVVGTGISATIVGEALDGGTVTVFGAAGLVATVQASAPEALGVHLDIAADAVPGERLLFVETPGGTTGVSFTVNSVGGPVVDAVSPTLLATRGLPLDATVTGANLGMVSAVTVSGAGVSVATIAPSPDGTTLALGFAVDATADLGTHAVTLTAPTSSAVLQLYVQRRPPAVTAVHPAAGEVGATVPITITGTNLTGTVLVVTTPGTAQDVTVADVATPDDGTLTATLTIAPTATASVTEPRLLIVTSESGQTTIEFFVVAAGALAVTGIEPGAGEQGATSIPVTIHGLHLTGASVTGGAPDMTLANEVVVDDETLTLEVSIAPAVATGDRTLTVSGPAGSTPVTFRILAPGDPFIGSVRPPFANRGSTILLFLKGVNLDLVVPGSGVSMSPASGLVFSNAAWDAAAGAARVTVDVGDQANIGQRDVKVTLTTPGKSYTKSQSWRANNPGHVPIIDDVSPHLVDPGTTTSMTVTGSDFAGGAVLVTGPGATVTNTVVDPGGTLITFDLTLAADAPAENRAVIVVTEAGTARCGIATDPTPPPFLPAKLVKTGALFLAPAPGFRLFVFEFSAGPLFTPGLRTRAIPDADGSLTLSRLDAFAIERAFRELHRGWVRVRAVTPTNRIAVTPATAIRR